jgi:hypothetical protein
MRSDIFFDPVSGSPDHRRSAFGFPHSPKIGEGEWVRYDKKYPVWYSKDSQPNSGAEFLVEPSFL